MSGVPLIDASSPAIVGSTSTGSITTASFNPPAGSWVYVLIPMGMNTTTTLPSITVSDNKSHTWTALESDNNGGDTAKSVFIYASYLSSAATGMTVTVNSGTGWDPSAWMFKVVVVTNANTTQTGVGGFTAHNSTFSHSDPYSGVLTPSGSSSLILICCGVYAPGTLGEESGTTFGASYGSSGSSGVNAWGYNNAGTTAGVGVTVGFTGASTLWAVAAIEVLAIAGSPTTVNLTTAQVNVAALAPVVNIGGQVVNLLTAQVNVAALAPTVTHSQITSGGPGTAGNIKLTYISAQTQALTYSISPIAGFDPYGNQIPAGYQGPLSAIQPGTAPAVTETWHSLDLTVEGNSVASGNGVNGFWYRYRGDNEVELLWDLTLTSATSSPILGILPLGYWPAVPQNLLSGWYGTGPGAYSTTFSPHMSVSTLGVLTAVNCNSLTTVSLAGRTKMTLDVP